jgi:hypothetical protein
MAAAGLKSVAAQSLLPPGALNSSSQLSSSSHLSTPSLLLPGKCRPKLHKRRDAVQLRCRAAVADADWIGKIKDTPLRELSLNDGQQTNGAMSHPKDWTPDSWRSFVARQQPDYPDQEKLAAVKETLERYPPLVFAGEARALEEKLAQAALGKAFVLQGGDCAESFKEFHANNIRDTFRVILQMSVVLMYGGALPVVKVCADSLVESQWGLAGSIFRHYLLTKVEFIRFSGRCSAVCCN